MYAALGNVARYTMYPTTLGEGLASQRKTTECAVAGGTEGDEEPPEGTPEETPVPLNAMTVGEFVALLLIFTLPFIFFAFFGAKVTSNVTVCPGAIVAPSRPLLRLASIPVSDTPEIFTFELPVFLRVTASLCAFPTVPLPKDRLAGDADIVPVSFVPVPVILSVRSLAELLLSVMSPLSVPTPVGANLSMKLVVLRAGSVNGVVNPMIVKPAPRTLALEMVALCVPEFFNSTVWEMLVPTGALPKLTLLGVVSSGTGATPVPLRE
jgi:hypothetical protein